MEKLALQGINSSLGVSDVQVLDVLDLAQASDLAVDALKSTGSTELAQPGISIVASHIVVGVVACNHHQRAQDDLGVASSLDGLDDVLAGGLLGLTLNSADEHVVVAQGLHGGLHLAVTHLCGMGGAVDYENEGDLVLSGGV